MKGSIQSSHLNRYTHGTSYVNYSVFKSLQSSLVTHFSDGLKKKKKGDVSPLPFNFASECAIRNV